MIGSSLRYHPLPDGPTPAWLTAVLREAGALPRGAVTSLESRGGDAFNADVSFLRAGYSPDAPPDAPRALALKRNRPEPWAVAAGADEARFYQLVASLPDHPPVTVPCYAAAVDAEGGGSYILLQDLSATHAPPVTREQQIGLAEAVPREEHIDAVVGALASLHGYWWGHPLARGDAFTVGHWTRSEERHGAYLERRRAAWASMVEGEGDWLPREEVALYTALLDALPGFWERHLAPRFRELAGLTLVHGDSYFANFLCPREPGGGPAYLLDWQSPSFDLAGYDLANLLTPFWTPEQRHEGGRERRALERYHRALLAGQPGACSLEQLLDDYRAGLIFWALMPVQDRHGGAPRDYWWPKMQCLVAAFRDWRCGELLGL